MVNFNDVMSFFGMDDKAQTERLYLQRKVLDEVVKHLEHMADCSAAEAQAEAVEFCAFLEFAIKAEPTFAEPFGVLVKELKKADTWTGGLGDAIFFPFQEGIKRTLPSYRAITKIVQFKIEANEAARPK